MISWCLLYTFFGGLQERERKPVGLEWVIQVRECRTLETGGTRELGNSVFRKRLPFLP